MRQNVKKDINYIFYKGTVESEDVPCSYVGSTEIDPRANIEIIHKEDEISENSLRVFNGEVTWQGTTITVSSKNFLLTDVFGDYKSDKLVPYYWKHVLPSGNIDADSVKIVDGDLVEVQESSYRTIQHNTYDETTGLPITGTYDSCAVYSNYENSYDEQTGEVKLYFVMYKVSGTSHYALLNQQPVFREATYDDVWSVTSSLKPWEKVYIVSPGTTDFTVTVPNSTTTYSLKLNTEGRIFVKDFLDVSDEEPWFPRISNGSFNKLVSSERYVYSVPEFSSQSFNPTSPYKSIVGERALRIRGDIYKVDATPLQVDTTLYILDVVIKDKFDNVLYAFTTDSSKNGDYYYHAGERVYRDIELRNEWVSWDTSGIIGWDIESGFIHLQDDFPDNYVCEVSYYFEEKYLQYTGLNINPVFDETYNGQFYVLYVVPTGGSNDNASQTASVNYIKVNRSGKIIATSQDGTAGNYNLNNVIETDGENIHYSLFANSTSYGTNSSGSSSLVIDNGNNSSNFPDNGVLVIGNSAVTASSTQIIGYSAKSVGASTTTFTLISPLTATVSSGTSVNLFSFVDLLSSGGQLTNSMQWFVLAELHIATTYRPEELSLIDVREKGGVIKEEVYDEANIIDPRAVWLRPEHMITRGQPVPGESVAVIKVPFTILSDYGGTFKKEDVEEVVRRHIATGVMPVVIYHGAIPEITSAASTTTTVTICWGSEGSSYSYYVYQSSLEDGPWTLVNSTAVSDQVYGNCYTITGLTTNTVYYFTVTSLSTDGIESPKSIAWGIKTKAS